MMLAVSFTFILLLASSVPTSGLPAESAPPAIDASPTSTASPSYSAPSEVNISPSAPIYTPPNDLIRLPRPPMVSRWRTFVSMKQFKCAFSPAPGKVNKPTDAQIKSWIPTLNSVLERYEITSSNQVTMFLAQTGHESDNFKTFEEYSNTWCTRYDGGCAFKGRGAIQLTHRGNYALAADHLNAPELLTNPEIVANDPLWAFETAAWYWRAWGISPLSDRGDFEAVTRKINTRLAHYEYRLKQLKKIQDCIKPSEFLRRPRRQYRGHKNLDV